MKRLKGRIIKRRFMGFDVETVGDNNEFYSGGLWWRDEHGFTHWKYFKCKYELSKFLNRKKFRKYYIVATNLSFDFTSVYWNTNIWNDFHIIFRGSKILLAEYKLPSRNGAIKYIDTMNYIPFGVAKLAEVIGMEKLPYPSFWDFDEDGNVIRATKPKTYEEEKELELYNKNDCKISALFMEFLQKGVNNLGGNLKITSASTSLDIWRRNFQPFDLMKEEYILQDEDIKDFIFDGYYGGRTEVFKRGTIKNAYYYDINSLYPAVMRERYPNPNTVRKIQNPNISHINRYHGVSKVTVYCPKMRYPLLSYRYNGKLTFPTGEFTATFNHIELQRAIELGYEIKQIHKTLIYEQSFEPFKKFSEKMYDLRSEFKQTNNPFELVVKMCMNSLYGKFAQRKMEDYKIIDQNSLSNEDLQKIMNGSLDFDFVGDKIITKKEKLCNSVFTFPILSSYVTSYARLLMYDYIVGYEAVYTDTDSIITIHKIPESDELGKMKLEADIEKAIIIKPKMYYIKGEWYKNGEKISKEKVKAKGIKHPNKKDFENILLEKAIEKNKLITLKESIRRGLIPNAKLDFEKNVTLEDNKRVWNNKFNYENLEDSTPIQLTKELIKEVET